MLTGQLSRSFTVLSLLPFSQGHCLYLTNSAQEGLHSKDHFQTMIKGEISLRFLLIIFVFTKIDLGYK